MWLSGYTKLVLQDANGNLDLVAGQVSSSPPRRGEGQWIGQTVFALRECRAVLHAWGPDGSFQVGMRVQATVAAGTITGTITASAASGSPLTTAVTVAWDSGQLDAGLSAIGTGVITEQASALPAFVAPGWAPLRAASSQSWATSLPSWTSARLGWASQTTAELSTRRSRA